MPDMFPVLMDYRERKKFPACPHNIPWAMIEPHEKQALRNHEQTLKRLAERGGLSPTELIAVLDGHPLRWIFQNSKDIASHVEALIAKVAEFNSSRA